MKTSLVLALRDFTQCMFCMQTNLMVYTEDVILLHTCWFESRWNIQSHQRNKTHTKTTHQPVSVFLLFMDQITVIKLQHTTSVKFQTTCIGMCLVIKETKKETTFWSHAVGFASSLKGPALTYNSLRAQMPQPPFILWAFYALSNPFQSKPSIVCSPQKPFYTQPNYSSW